MSQEAKRKNARQRKEKSNRIGRHQEKPSNLARLYCGEKIGWNKFLVRERNLVRFVVMFHSSCLFPVLNLSLFSGLLVCQLLVEPLFNPWMFGLCLIGAVGNLCWSLVVLRAASDKSHQEKSPRSEEQSAIMSDLDREIVRRREIEKVEKN